MPDLTPSALIAAILQEFTVVEFLSNAPTQYALQLDGALLDPALPLVQQVRTGDHLVLLEKEAPIPPGAQRPSHALYLREQNSGIVYPLPWVPAVIGRPDRDQPHNEWLAVNLTDHRSGVRVSRRHAQITEEQGQFYVASLSNNPTYLRQDILTTEVTAEPQRLHHGDVIILERSYIALKFIVREASGNGQM
ncbi:MAG: FHA domain-containing protein [Caldilineaceae bacterium]